MSLEIKNLNVNIGEKQILRDFSLEVPAGQVHAIMGPNGTGKSTLAKALAGHEDYEISGGEALLDGENVVGMEPDEIARLGLFVAFQYPVEIPGVTIANFIRAALQARLPEGEKIVATDYYKTLRAYMDELKIDRAFSARNVNEGFSGGEKKRCEILQMKMLDPKYVIMDETDSGLDIDALKIVAEGVNNMRSPDRGFLVITHYQRLLDYIVPDVVHIMWDGRIVKTGDKNLALEMEEKGYDWVKEELATAGA
ncbi:Fe-S cluster assembly ATPase SufC [Cerasicoccus maritimus]|uniref:Fe-S cluster assembly ATPase SufC n=1 Tax=Cerasicoccus maritimus TaxID=490089 RepID=UPI0028529C2A|nr:Fe-S cluster assembly ATPase SufC [Cerasicoccus maritimus]